MKHLILCNLGSPDEPTSQGVTRFLAEFLCDPQVIDLPAWVRYPLVRGLIIPLRRKRVVQQYLRVWSEEGSPLRVWGHRLAQLVEKKLAADGSDWVVHFAARYGKPNLRDTVQMLRDANVEVKDVALLPLYPQYATSTTKTSIDYWEKLWDGAAPRVVSPNGFASHPLFVEAWSELLKEQDLSSFDKVLFSFHGVPLRHLRNTYSQPPCKNSGCVCAEQFSEENERCYYAACHATARNISSALSLPDTQWEVTFQSRIGPGWTQPFTDVRVDDLARAGSGRVLVVSPSFIADCLETLYELKVELADGFTSQGGEELAVAPSLNDDAKWVDCVVDMAQASMGG